MQFTTTNLVGDRVLVKGTDKFGTEGSQVVSSTQWNDVLAHDSYLTATDAYETAVEEFFAPLMAAAAQAEKKLARPKNDPSAYVVLHEGVEAVAGEERVLIQLDKDSVILRLISDGDFDRLVWVADELEVLEVETDEDDDLMGVAAAAGVEIFNIEDTRAED